MTSLSARALLALSVAGLTMSGCGPGAGEEAAAPPPACDRTCLIDATDRYLRALVAHDPAAGRVGEQTAFVENVQRLKPGEGLWKTLTGGPTDFRIYVPDVDQQQAGWMGVVEREGKPALLALRLKLDNGRVTEAEHIVADLGERVLDNVKTVRAGLVAQVPEANRLSHDALGRIGMTYYDALDDNDGSKTPFAADCQRRENGMTTAGEGIGPSPVQTANSSPVASQCKAQLDSNSFQYIDRIENRRMIAADPQTGLVLGFSHFRHPMTNLPYVVTHADGSTSERNRQNMPYEPFDMPAAHIFKIGADGKVHEIEAVGVRAPYNAPTGWE